MSYLYSIVDYRYKYFAYSIGSYPDEDHPGMFGYFDTEVFLYDAVQVAIAPTYRNFQTRSEVFKL